LILLIDDCTFVGYNLIFKNNKLIQQIFEVGTTFFEVASESTLILFSDLVIRLGSSKPEVIVEFIKFAVKLVSRNDYDPAIVVGICFFLSDLSACNTGKSFFDNLEIFSKFVYEAIVNKAVGISQRVQLLNVFGDFIISGRDRAMPLMQMLLPTLEDLNSIDEQYQEDEDEEFLCEIKHSCFYVYYGLLQINNEGVDFRSSLRFIYLNAGSDKLSNRPLIFCDLCQLLDTVLKNRYAPGNDIVCEEVRTGRLKDLIETLRNYKCKRTDLLISDNRKLDEEVKSSLRTLDNCLKIISSWQNR